MKGVVANRSMGWWKASLEGSAVGLLLSLLSIWLLGVPPETLLAGYALLLLLFSAYLTSYPREGALLGLFAVIGESVIDFVYFVSVKGLLAPLLPYAVGSILFFGRIPFFPLFGAIGGYLGREYFTDKSELRMRGRNRGPASRKRVVKEARKRKQEKEKKERY
jgi:hypothetical protein